MRRVATFQRRGRIRAVLLSNELRIFLRAGLVIAEWWCFGYFVFRNSLNFDRTSDGLLRKNYQRTFKGVSRQLKIKDAMRLAARELA